MISIIIPVLNEASIIGTLLKHLITHSKPENITNIIVVDGGSTDKTLQMALSFKEVTTISSTRGRAKQMNIGAKNAQGSILYFLHADSFPPKDFDQHIINQTKKGNQAGCFRMQFDSSHWWLRLASWFTQFNWRACRGGDQSLFITKTLFNSIGGFDENYTIYEDNIMISHLYAKNQFVVINKKLKTSARMYRKIGVWKLQYIYWTIYLKKWLGADPVMLHTFYRDKINY